MRRLVVAVCALGTLALAGCGSDPAPSGPATPEGGGPATTAGGDGGGGGGNNGSGCAVISAEQVGSILGEPYVETPTGIEGAGPDGSYTEDGVSGFACLFSPADGDVHDLSITTFSDSSDMYDLLAEDAGGTPVNGVGVRAVLVRDAIEAMIIAENSAGTVATVVLTNLDGSPIEDELAELTRIVLAAA